MRCRVLEKDILGLILSGSSCLLVVVAMPDERLQEKNKKVLLRWCDYADGECLVHTNKRAE